MRWEELVRTASRQKDNLLAAMERYDKLSRDMKEMLHWIMQTERSIADDEKEFEKGELMKDKVEHYRVRVHFSHFYSSYPCLVAVLCFSPA